MADVVGNPRKFGGHLAQGLLGGGKIAQLARLPDACVDLIPRVRAASYNPVGRASAVARRLDGSSCYRTGDTRSRDIVEAFGSTVFGVLSLALLALDLVTFAAQERPPAGQSVPLYRGGVEVVNVAATVWDASGEPVTDLSADDFEIYERGRRQPVQVFQRIAIPILREAEELLLARDSPDVASNAFPTRHAPS